MYDLIMDDLVDALEANKRLTTVDNILKSLNELDQKYTDMPLSRERTKKKIVLNLYRASLTK